MPHKLNKIKLKKKLFTLYNYLDEILLRLIFIFHRIQFGSCLKRKRKYAFIYGLSNVLYLRTMNRKMTENSPC